MEALAIRAEEEVSLEELVYLSAADAGFYAQTFFPQLTRQPSPAFHAEMDAVLESPDCRYVAIKVFRGGAKTTKCWLYVSKRIAYGLSHTIAYVSNSQSHALEAINFLKRAVEFNKPWAQAFGLRKGNKWTTEEIEIFHGVENYPIRVKALGITGQVRGINVDGYRPDLIVVDDPDNEETTATPEQREKTAQLFFGALEKSLAPRSEAPHAKMILLQTPLNQFDLVSVCCNDPQWTSLTFGCFDEKGESRWPERFPTEELRAQKAAHIQRNQLALWMREMECTIISAELSTFKEEWLQYYDLCPEGGRTIIAIDPASSDAKEADDFALVVLTFYDGAVYLRHIFACRGVDLEQAEFEFFRLARQYGAYAFAVEEQGYQRVLRQYLESAMQRNRLYLQCLEVKSERRRKIDRLAQELAPIASQGKLYVLPEHTQFIQQFVELSPTYKGHDDVVDAVAIGVQAMKRSLNTIEGSYEVLKAEERLIPDLPAWRACP